MKKPRNIARYSLGLALAALTTVTNLALGHVPPAQAQVVTPNWTAATALPTLHANGKIAFTSDRDGNREIYSINPDGTDPRRLTFDPGVDDYPAWSSDGIKIAYLSESPFGQHAIKIMNADGSGQRIVTPVVFDLSTPNFCGERFSLSWSPDASKIVFQEFGHIVTVNVDGTNRQNITNTSVRESEPSWGRTGPIAYASTLRGGDEINGLDIRTTDGGYYADYGYFTCSISPDLSPDGTKLAYVHSNDFPPPGYITILPVDFHSFEERIFNFVSVMNVRWSPDGNFLAFTSCEYPNPCNVGIVDEFGQGRHVLALGTNPSWQPLGPSGCPNPIDCAESFVHQHYLDFLNREPDPDGLAYWTNRIAECGSDARCSHERRIGVSAAFFVEPEFQETGYFVYRLYKASFGRQPTYTEFSSDRSRIMVGANLEASKQAFADEWIQRPTFVAAYPIMTSNTEFVNKLFDFAGLIGSRYDPWRQQEILAMNAGRSRALVLRDMIEIADFKNTPDPNNPRYSELKQTSQYNPAFVLMQYFGYLRRDVDQNGYDFWLDVVNNREPNNYLGMVCAFITSTEYQLRFGSTVTRSNTDCGQ